MGWAFRPEENTVCVDFLDLSAGTGVPLRRGVSPREQPVGCCCILLISSRDSFGTLRLGKQARRDALWRGRVGAA